MMSAGYECMASIMIPAKNNVRCSCPAGWYVEDVWKDLDEGLYRMKRIESNDGGRE
jgi:hypothetical protein